MKHLRLLWIDRTFVQTAQFVWRWNFGSCPCQKITIFRAKWKVENKTQRSPFTKITCPTYLLAWHCTFTKASGNFATADERRTTNENLQLKTEQTTNFVHVDVKLKTLKRFSWNVMDNVNWCKWKWHEVF